MPRQSMRAGEAREPVDQPALRIASRLACEGQEVLPDSERNAQGCHPASRDRQRLPTPLGAESAASIAGASCRPLGWFRRYQPEGTNVIGSLALAATEGLSSFKAAGRENTRSGYSRCQLPAVLGATMLGPGPAAPIIRGSGGDPHSGCLDESARVVDTWE
jgi:hypothetical protein